MKKYNEYNPIFTNFYLTELLTIKDKNRKKVGDNYSLYLLIDDYLKDYGVYLFGEYHLQEGTILRGCTIDKKFPIENFPLLAQMYGWQNVDIYICLKRTEHCDYGFYFNTESLTIRLVEYRWGSVKKDRFYFSFAEFWTEAKTVKNKYSKLLPKEDYESRTTGRNT
jgi:hypothetical protein